MKARGTGCQAGEAIVHERDIVDAVCYRVVDRAYGVGRIQRMSNIGGCGIHGLCFRMRCGS
jgi:hypothetical protein